MFIPFSCTLLCDRLIPDICCCDSHWRISYLTLTCIHLIIAMLNTWYLTLILTMLYLTHDSRHRYLPCYIWHMIPDTGTCHAIFDTWYSNRYLPCYIWPMIPDTGTCHAIFDTWYPTLVLAMLYLTYDTWHRYLPCYTWHMIYNIGT